MKYIWTKHATARLKERRIQEDLVIKTLISADEIRDKGDAKEYTKRFDGKTIGVVVKENNNGELIVLSCFMNPPDQHTKDFKVRRRYFEMQKASPIRKLWLTFLSQLGF